MRISARNTLHYKNLLLLSGTHESCPNSQPYPKKEVHVSKHCLPQQTITRRTYSEYREIAVEEEKTRCDCLAILPYLRILLAKCKEEVVVQDGLTQASIQSPSPIPHDTLCSIWDDVPTPTRCKKLWMYLPRRHRRAVSGCMVRPHHSSGHSHWLWDKVTAHYRYVQRVVKEWMARGA